ncbi:MAG: peptidase U34, partial [Acidimicrobiia bacterium]
MCDTLCALPTATVDGVALFAKNSDRPAGEPQDLEWHPARSDHGRLRATHIDIDGAGGETIGVLGSRPRWCWGFEHGVNEAGLAVGNEAVWTTRNPARHPDALIGMDLVRLALERADRARAGVEVIVDLLDRYGQGGAGHDGGKEPYWSSFLLVDPHEAWVVDTSGPDHAAEQVDRTRALSNRPGIEAFAAEHELRRDVIDARVRPRLDASCAVLADGPLSAPRLQRHLRGHVGGEDGWTICMHAPEQETTASVVAPLPAEGPRIAHVLLGHPCRSMYVPVVVGEPLGSVPAWERFAA